MTTVGSYRPEVAEVPGATVLRSRVFVDQRDAALEEAGELIQLIEAGRMGADHVRAELGDVLLGRAPGRVSDEDVTLFKSVGLAVQDATAARAVLTRARELGLGTPFEL